MAGSAQCWRAALGARRSRMRWRVRWLPRATSTPSNSTRYCTHNLFSASTAPQSANHGVSNSVSWSSYAAPPWQRRHANALVCSNRVCISVWVVVPARCLSLVTQAETAWISASSSASIVTVLYEEVLRRCSGGVHEACSLPVMEGTAQVRAIEAEAELRSNGLGELVTVRQRNVEEQGFPAEFSGRADAVFLDLPGPWKVQIFTCSTNCDSMSHAPYACY